MRALKRDNLVLGSKVADIAITAAGFAVAGAVLHGGFASVPDMLAREVNVGQAAAFAALLLGWQGIYAACGLYESRWGKRIRDEVWDVVRATTLGTMLLTPAAHALGLWKLSVVFPAVLWGVTTAATLGVRLAAQWGLCWMRRSGRNQRHLAVVGTNARAVRWAEQLTAQAELGYRLVGFVDEAWEAGEDQLKERGWKRVANFREFPALLRDGKVDEVALALPLRSKYVEAALVVAQCEEQGVVVRCLTDLFELRKARAWSDACGEDEGLTVHAPPQKGWRAAAKRALDVTVAALMFLLLAPFLAVIALAVKLDTRGPVFYRQERVGLNRRRFRMVKFRTMLRDADGRQQEVEHLNEAAGPVFKICDDPRVTRVGRWLRRTSLDELPQLWSVLKGDMSLVGPRPMSVRDYLRFEEDWQRRRFSVRPGMTCLWQVNGRSLVPFEKWMELDLEYIERWSLWLDVKILAKTIPAVWKGSGAV